MDIADFYFTMIIGCHLWQWTGSIVSIIWSADTINVYTHIGFDDAEEELKRLEDFRKAQAEVEKKDEKPMSQKMFKVI